MRRRLFQPLGMSATQTTNTADAHRATGYEWDGQRFQRARVGAASQRCVSERCRRFCQVGCGASARGPTVIGVQSSHVDAESKADGRTIRVRIRLASRHPRRPPCDLPWRRPFRLQSLFRTVSGQSSHLRHSDQRRSMRSGTDSVASGRSLATRCRGPSLGRLHYVVPRIALGPDRPGPERPTRPRETIRESRCPHHPAATSPTHQVSDSGVCLDPRVRLHVRAALACAVWNSTPFREWPCPLRPPDLGSARPAIADQSGCCSAAGSRTRGRLGRDSLKATPRHDKASTSQADCEPRHSRPLQPGIQHNGGITNTVGTSRKMRRGYPRISITPNTLSEVAP